MDHTPNFYPNHLVDPFHSSSIQTASTPFWQLAYGICMLKKKTTRQALDTLVVYLLIIFNIVVL